MDGCKYKVALKNPNSKLSEIPQEPLSRAVIKTAPVGQLRIYFIPIMMQGFETVKRKACFPAQRGVWRAVF